DEKNEKLNHDVLVGDLDLLESAHAKLHGLLISTRMRKLMTEFGQRETDVYVASYPRSGTTLMQMMLYQMTTPGAMDFDHLYEVSPWCRFSAFFKRPMANAGDPRIVKTHDPYSLFEHIQKGKFIFIVRNCLDVIPSIYQQTKDYIDPIANFDQLSDRNMKNWFEYNMKWIENKNGHPILYVTYEDILINKAKVVSTISKFLNIELTDQIVDRVLQRTSFDFMKQHEAKFGEQPEHWRVYNNFIRSGRAGEGKLKFNSNQLSTFQDLSKQYKIEGTVLEKYIL
ncbi:MAG: sulfotransferase domain-containing protein, partial [Bacteroidota bacterium]